jgi:hypothetical protein
MAMYSEPVITVHLMVEGFQAALRRFQDASERWDHPTAYPPLFEALNWAVAIDDRCQEIWIPEGPEHRPGPDWQRRLSGEETLKGLRFVRNRVHHQWAEAFEIGTLREPTAERPVRWTTWVWKRVDDLPPAPDQHQNAKIRPFYDELLAGKPVEPTLVRLEETFELVARLLEPRLPQDDPLPADRRRDQAIRRKWAEDHRAR